SRHRSSHSENSYARNTLLSISRARWGFLAAYLRSAEARSFIQAASFFAEGDITKSLRELDRILSPFQANKWTIVTYLPFLWKPSDHMFLKPDATKDFAERIGHRFAKVYRPDLDARVYESLLALTDIVKSNLVDLQPRDNIDVQSFIWVVSGSYDGEHPRT
ncbi:hypothetical protein FHW77_005030, partial [Agrobacterium sp. RC10-4-1]|uniref:hypothetical protein n=1 Tax=Agrobacterium sp. RC10-4-1 TaxID=2587039 RepID=UPI00178FF7F7